MATVITCDRGDVTNAVADANGLHAPVERRAFAQETIHAVIQVPVVGARRRSARFSLRRIAGSGGRRRASDRDRIVSEPGLLLLPAGQREPDPILPAVRRARTQFRRHLLGSARLEGYFRHAAIHPAAI